MSTAVAVELLHQDTEEEEEDEAAQELPVAIANGSSRRILYYWAEKCGTALTAECYPKVKKPDGNYGCGLADRLLKPKGFDHS